MDEFHGLIAIFGFSILIIGIIFMLFGKKSNVRQQSLAIAYTGGGIALILGAHFLENPDSLELATAEVAAIVVAGIIVVLKYFIRRR